jgi:iron complex outermembrane receptor protein
MTIALAAPPAHAAEAAAAAAAGAKATPVDEKADYGVRVEELTVVGTSGAAASAPVKASLEATEPQAIITREAIDQFIPQTADYTQIVLLSPSISGVSQNGPGFYEAKTTLRGFKDGEYNVTYDGIPFGDTNDPTHHSTSFFPAATIGAVVVDRGPGSAGQLGQANFGGSINLFSPEVAETFGGSAAVTYGSWNSEQAVVKVNTGPSDLLHGTRALVDLSALRTDGYLTYSGAQGANILLRSVTPITDNWSLTLFSTYNYTRVYQDDNNGATLAQVAKFGKNFALTNDPTQATYFGFNTVKKHSSMSYARLNGDLTPSLHLEDTAYTYYYSNHTVSPQDITGTAAPSKTLPAGDIPGYFKLNYYHVYGDILRLTQDLPFGAIKAGILWETSKSKRARLDYDLTARTFDFKETCPKLLPGVVCNRGAASFVNYVQGSTIDQYQPFVDFEWRVTPQLTITPGIKYVHFERSVNSPVNQGSGTQLNASESWSKTLYFLTGNYRILENWSAYAQYATGFLTPPLSTLQVQIPDASAEKPQESKNYQIGTVFHGGRLTLDADVYYIDFKNKFQSVTGAAGTPQAGETVFFNLGGAVYKGVEAQATLQLQENLYVFANGSANSAKAKGGATTIAGAPFTVPGGTQIAGAPKWTAAAGLIWKPGDWSISVTDKVVGEQWANEGEPSNFKIQPYSDVDLTVVRNLGRWRLEAAVYNLFDSQKITSIKPAGKGNAISPADQYYYQPERSAQLTARLNF